jgi:hypothetical protein
MSSEKARFSQGLTIAIGSDGGGRSIQHSSLAWTDTDDGVLTEAIWLGVDVNLKGEKVGERTHLRRRHVNLLWP